MATLETLRFNSRMRGPVALISSEQNFTTDWADLGSDVLDLSGVDNIALYLTLDANSATNMRVRLLALHSLGGTEYMLPIATSSSSVVAIDGRYQEFTDDTDQNIVITWELNGLVPFGQFQISAGAAGSTGQVDAAHVTTAQGR